MQKSSVAKMRGARDMLRAAATEFRKAKNPQYALRCDVHADAMAFAIADAEGWLTLVPASAGDL